MHMVHFHTPLLILKIPEHVILSSHTTSYSLAKHFPSIQEEIFPKSGTGRMRLGFSFLLILPWLHLATGSLLIGAFNIKTFGDKKASNTTLVDIIVKIVHRYDIILIQEVRDSDLTATHKLMESVNSGISPFHYEYIVSESLGRDTYKERYLFIYRGDMVSVVESFLYDDGCEACGTDAFSREPFVVMFSSKHSGVPDFALIPQHTSPDSAVKEIDALYDVVDETRSFLGTDNILLLGDFNAGCNFVHESDWDQIRLHTDPSYRWLIPNSADTTVTNTECPYDRIVATATMMQYVVPGSAAVYDFMTALKLSQSLALAVSDHFPVEVQLRGA